MTESNKRKFYEELGFVLSDARKNANLSQELLAEKIGMSRVSIVNIEKGRQAPPLHLLWSLSKIVGKDLSELIPNFELNHNELNPSLKRIIKKKEKEGQFNDESRMKINSFLTKTLG